MKLKKETALFHDQISKTFLELYMPFVVLIGLIMPEPINPTYLSNQESLEVQKFDMGHKSHKDCLL